MAFIAYEGGRCRLEDHIKCFVDLMDDVGMVLYPYGTARDVSTTTRIYYTAEWAGEVVRSQDGKDEHGVVLFHLFIAGRSQNPIDDVQTALREIKDQLWSIWKERIVDIREQPWDVDEDEIVLPVDVHITF